MEPHLPLTVPPLPPPSAVRKRTEQPPPRSSSRCAAGAAPARPGGFEEGAAVYLYHAQERRWQKGVISDRRALEYGSGWPDALGWKGEWTGLAVETVEVQGEEGGDPLSWDANCNTRSLPKHFWKAKLRHRYADIEEPCTVEAALRFREEEVLSAATVLPNRMADSEQPLDESGVVESRRRTPALLDVRAPRSCPAPLR